jgi:hypothetical protein
VNATEIQKVTIRRENRPQRQEQREDPPAWHASVCDEVCSSSDGALLRRIKILITNGPQLAPEEAA